MPDDLSGLDVTAMRIFEGRKTHYAGIRLMHPSTRRVIDAAVDRRLDMDAAQRRAASEVREKPMVNEVEIWKSTAEVRAATELSDAQTRQMIAENSLGITEQQQAEAHREHERKLELRRLTNEHELNKLSTIDVTTEQEREHSLATQRHDAVVARQKGLIKGLIVGTPIGWAIGFGSGIALGLFL